MNNELISSQPAGTGFAELGIAPALLAALRRLKYHTPTPIQTQAIPPAIQGKDIVGIAQTGTGKTLAFGIPMIQRLAGAPGKGLVILPTRELALQVDESLRGAGAELGVTTAVLIGGTSLVPQVKALAKNPRIVIATPGRLIDHLNQRTLSLNAVRILVLDEADRMLDMGFAPQIKKIFAHVPRERQTMLFSATMPKEIMGLATAQMKLPIRVEVAPAGTTAERVTQELFIIHKNDKNRMIEKLLGDYAVTTLIFTRTKYGAKRLVRVIRELGHTVAELHSNRSLNQRRDALEGFKSGKYRVLVATDIASRGIDVVGIGLVVNYDVPTDAEDYVHRIGRTARAGESGHAITLVTPEQRGEIRDIERLVRQTLRVSPLPELPPARMPQPQNNGRGRGFSGRNLAGLVCMLALLSPAFATAAFFPDAVPLHDIGASRTFHGELKGAPERYTFTLKAQQTFYANLLVPDAERQRKDFLVEVISERGARYAMDGGYFYQWVPYATPDGARYLKGPEIAPTLYPGTYGISISNTDNHGVYVLVISDAPGNPDIPKSASTALFIAKAKPVVVAAGIVIAALAVALYVRRYLRQKV